MVELYLLRHAHAGDPAAWTGDDDLRPLSAKGRRQAARLGAYLAEMGFAPDVILTSPLLRALQTAEAVADSLAVHVQRDSRLGGWLDLAVLDAILSDAGDPVRPLLVGHDPDFSELVSELVGAPIPMRKGALARIDVSRPLEPGTGELRWLLPPDFKRGQERA
jgi:phosphohistidine phosphatase SixA